MTGEDALSPKTVKAKYLVAVKTVFGAGVRSQLLPDNPAKDVQVRVRKQKVLRDKGYSGAEAKMILEAAGRIRHDSPRHNELSKRSIEWGPCIAAHTGARISEVMQLRKQDVEQHDGLPCIRITPEAGAVKNGEFRVVPLHRQLIERGLLEFVQASKDDYLFIKGDEDLAIVRDRAGRAGSMVSKWVREVVGLTDENIQPNHAWRHRFKTVARELGEDRLADAIQGHSDGRAATGYGAHTVRAMNVLIGKMPAYEV